MYDLDAVSYIGAHNRQFIIIWNNVGMASTLCAQERGDMLVSGSLSWSSSSTKTTVIKQDGDNKVSNRDFSLGLNVGATIAFNYYF